MAQAALTQILNVMNTLEPEELHTVERAAQGLLRQQQATMGYSQAEWGALQAMLQAGLLTEIKPKSIGRKVERPEIIIEGKPLSETIIEERR